MFNTTTAAEAIGCSISTVSRWAARLDLGKRVGASIILTEKEVELIRQQWRGQKGNPNFGTRETRRK